MNEPAIFMAAMGLCVLSLIVGTANILAHIGPLRPPVRSEVKRPKPPMLRQPKLPPPKHR